MRLDAAAKGLGAVWAADDGASVVLGGAFVLLVGDGVRPWEIVPLRGSPQFAGAAGAGALRIAVGYPHAILVSHDSGVKWQSRAAPKRKVEHVVCTASGVIVTAGDDGAYRSDDAGRTFRACGGDIRVVALDGTRLLGVESKWGASILREWDDAAGWWREVGAMPEYVKGLARAGDALVAIATGGGFRSGDRGGTWEPVVANDPKTYVCAVAGNVAGCVAIGGYYGLLAVSRDAGLTWSKSTVTDRKLEGVCVTAAGIVWAVGEDGVVIRSGSQRLADVSVAQGAAKPTRASKKNVIAREPEPEVHAPTPLPRWSPPEPFGAPVHDSPVTAIAFLDEDRVISADATGRLALHTRGEDGRWTTTAIARATTAIHALAVAGARLIVAGEDAVEVIDPTTGRELHRVKLGATHVTARGARIAVVCEDAVIIFDLEDHGALERRATIAAIVADLDVSVDGERVAIACADGTVAIHDAATGAQRSTFRRAGARVRFTPDPDELYLVCGNYGVLRVSAAKGGKRGELHGYGRQRAIVTSPTARYRASLSVADELDVAATAYDVALLGWNADRDTTLCGAPRRIPYEQIRERVFSRHRFVLEEHAALTAVAVSDAGRVAVGDLGGEVALFDATTLALERAAQPRSTRVQPALDPPLIEVAIAAAGPTDDGRALLLGADHRVRMLDCDSGELRAGPRVETTEPTWVCAFGEMLIVRSADGWCGYDLATGARRWVTSFPVREAVRYGDALYGFEARGSYVIGKRIGHALYRLDVQTGAVAKVELPAPPGADDADGYASLATPTAHGLFAIFSGDRRGVRGVLIDPDTRTVRDGPLETDNRCLMAHMSAVVDPSGRYLLWPDKGGAVIRDGHDPALAVVARPRIDGHADKALPLVAAGRVVAHDRSRQLLVCDLEGEVVATLRGCTGGESLIAGARGSAVVSWSKFHRVVRRWPVP